MGSLDIQAQTELEKQGVSLIALPNIFDFQRIRINVPSGKTVAELVDMVAPDADFIPYAQVLFGPDEIPESMWHCVIPKDGTVVSVRFVPGKGGGKSGLSIVLSLALMVAAPYAATALASSFGFGGVWAGSLYFTSAQVFRAAIGIVGMLAIRALAPPPKQPGAGGTSPTSNPALFITGAQNQVIPWGAVPVVLGQMRMVPPMGARPYTETVGSDQYLRMLFVWGYGPLEITQLKIGETDLASFANVEIENRKGYLTDAPLTLYSDSVLQNDLSIAVTNPAYTQTSISCAANVVSLPPGHGQIFAVNDPVTMSGWTQSANNGTFIITAATANTFTIGAGLTNDAGGEAVTIHFSHYQVQTTAPNADEISIDLTWPSGLVSLNSSGGKNNATVQLEVQYAPTGTQSWSNNVSAYTVYSTAISPALALPANAGESLYYRVYIDPASGGLGMVAGATAYSGTAPQIPLLPTGVLALARVLRVNGDASNVPSNRITDERDQTLVGVNFQATGDFLPGTSATVNVISLASGGLKYPGSTVTAAQTTATRRELNFKVPTGQYDVRVRRVTLDSTSSQLIDAVDWTALRTIRYTAPVTMPGLAMTAIRIKATNQLNGTINQLNGVVQSILPTWNGTDWTTITATANPAALYRNILQGAANARPLIDERIDLTGLQTWYNNCVAASRECNAIIGTAASVLDNLSLVASCGRAAPGLIDGKWTVIEDKAQTVPVQHFTPRNTWGFAGVRTYPDQPDAFRVQFTNRANGWNPDERIVYDDGFNADGSGGLAKAQKFETLALTGVTSADQAWKDGRYHIGSARLRPETYTFYADIEHLRCTRGDLIKFTHDVPLFGLMTGRVKALTTVSSNTTALTLDAQVTLDGTKNYGIRIRKADGTSLRLDVTNPGGGAYSTVTLVTPYDTATGPAVGDLFMFGVRGSETVDLIVKSVEPAADLTAKITAVDYAVGLQTADTGMIPAFNSQITTPQEFIQPPPPVVDSVQADDGVIIANTDGSFSPSIVLTLAPSGYALPLSVDVMIQAIGETQYAPARFTVNANQITVTGVDPAGLYNLSLVYKNQIGLASLATVVPSVLVTGGTSQPDDVTGFIVNIYKGTAYLQWDAVASATLSAYEIKYNTATSGANWANSFSLVANLPSTQTSIAVPALPGTYLIKALNENGLDSANETLIVSTITSLAGLTSVLTITENPNFYGPKTNCTVSAGALTLTDTTVGVTGAALASGTYYFDLSNYMDDWLNVDLVDNWDTYVEETGDLGAVYTTTVNITVTAIGIDTSSHVDDWANVDNVISWDQSVSPSAWGLGLQIRTTQTNPAISPVWSDWMDFVVGEYTARALQFRLILYSYATLVTPSITALAVSLTMPNRTDAQNNLTANAGDLGGTAVTFLKSFKSTPSIQPVGQSMSTGDYWQITNQSATGFNIAFFNIAASRITKTFDYSATGIGQGA